MPLGVADIAFTPTVRAEQERRAHAVVLGRGHPLSEGRDVGARDRHRHGRGRVRCPGRDSPELSVEEERVGGERGVSGHGEVSAT